MSEPAYAVPGRSPASVPEGLPRGSADENRVFGFWVFLAGEASLFASLIGTFLALSRRTAGGPGPRELFDLPLVGVATVALLTSSLTCAFAVLAAREGRLRAMQLWLAATAALGEAFLAIQAYEFWSYAAHAGFGFSTSAFASAFYTLVGFHGLHVTFGVFWLLAALFQSILLEGIAREEAARLFVAGLYWHFVDVVWVVIFSAVYLLGVAGAG
ncbi:MAG: cytochrome c oxidase subunit 3 [Clostridia bacterium]|nr:cytochrome c oxidase subunit 3 [Clostridia bacterium]